jgi:hypothetical protein
MWRRKFSLLAATGLLAAQTAGFEGLLSQFEQQANPTPAQIERNLAQIAGGIGQWGAAATPRVRGYLDSVQGHVGGRRNLGLAMAGVYRQLGGMETNPQLAWLNYRNAFVMLNQFPLDNQIRGEMQQIRRSVELIEARLPELPRLDWSALDAASQKDYDEVMQRYISVSAAASAAEVLSETMRRSLADQGLAVRPQVVSGLTRMRLKLEDAKRLIEQQNYKVAKDRLASAEAEAQKLMKMFGA